MRVVTFHRGDTAETDFGAALSDRCQAAGHNLFASYGPEPGQRLDYTEVERQFEEMRAMLAGPQGKPSLILVPDVTHLARNLEQMIERMLVLDTLNCEVRCADQECPDPLQNGVQLLEVGDKAQRSGPRIRESLIERATSGKVAGRTPYGYFKGGDDKLRINQDEMKPVLSVYDMCASGIGLRRIARRLREQGYKTRTGKPWSQVALSNMVRNRVYIGTYIRCGVRIVNNHQPLVDMDLFRKANEELTQRRNNNIKSVASTNSHPLSGLLLCECGGSLAGVSRHRSWELRNGTTQKRAYRYYECSQLQTIGEGNHTSISTVKLHKQIGGWLKKHRAKSVKEMRARYLEALHEQQTKHIANIEKHFKIACRMLAEGRGRLPDIRPLLEYMYKERQTLTRIPTPRVGEIVNNALDMDGSAKNIAALTAVLDKVTVTTAGTIAS